MGAVVRPSSLDPLRIRKGLGRFLWGPPVAFGPDGWTFTSDALDASVIVSCAPFGDDGEEWVHASIAHRDTLPTYGELCLLRDAVYADGWSYQVFAPPVHHVNIHPFALHLYGRLDGTPALPRFDHGGSI